ncbi:MAG: DUF4372 domain-containing protein [Paludibacter sp.]|nr:DUF4372 domain-containing protein [Paludibacter sp.]
MNSGKTVLSQLIMFRSDFQFQRYVDRYKGDFLVRRFSCNENSLVMSFAQRTAKESLRDIENSLTAFSSKLYHFGLRFATAKSTLAETNEKRNWRIYADYAQVLIKQTRALFADDPNFRFDIDNMVYAIDSTTIYMCLSMFFWAKLRKTKGAVKMNTVLYLRGSMPIYVDITNANVHDINILDICIYLLTVIAINETGHPCKFVYFYSDSRAALFEKTNIKELFSGNNNLNKPSDYPYLPL